MDNIAYWLEMSPAYQFHAQAPVFDPSHTDVLRGGPVMAGAFIAVPSGDGSAYWGFGRQDDRSAFLAAYPQAAELATGNLLPAAHKDPIR